MYNTRTILVTKKLGVQTKRPEILVCYDFYFGILDEEEDMMFATRLNLFSIKTITIILILNQFLNQSTYQILV
jgi:hypothetical protein